MAGDFAGARVLLGAALAASPDSPDVLDGLGALQQDMGDYLLAEQSYRNALSKLRPENELRRARVLNNLATLYLETGRQWKLDGIRKELEAIPFAAIEQSPSDAATIMATLAGMRRMRGDNLAAQGLYERSIALWRRTRNADAMVAYVTTSVGNMHIEEGKFDEAATQFKQAIEVLEARVGPDHAMLIRPLFGLAVCMCQAGEAAEAEPVARRAAEISRNRMGAVHPVTAEMMQLQAHVLRRLGRKREAGALEKEAAAILRNVSERNLGGFTVDVRELSRKKPRG